MKKITVLALAMFAAAVLAPTTAALAHEKHSAKRKPASRWVTAPQKQNGSGVSISYALASTPVLGQPLTIDLSISGVTDAAGATVDYQAPSGMTLMRLRGDAQLAAGSTSSHRIVVVPNRDGLSYVSVQTTQSGRSSVIAIAIQVGAEANLQKSGKATTAATGDKLIELPAQMK
jgi:hypothetical protein